MKTLDAGTLERWRDWLEEHHASESEVWLVFYKQQTGVASIGGATSKRFPLSSAGGISHGSSPPNGRTRD